VTAPGTEGAQVVKGALPQGFRLNAELLLAGMVQTVGPGEVLVLVKLHTTVDVLASLRAG